MGGPTPSALSENSVMPAVQQKKLKDSLKKCHTNAHNGETICQRSTWENSRSLLQKLGLSLDIPQKAKTLHQQAQLKGSLTLESVGRFSYLGSYLSTRQFCPDRSAECFKDRDVCRETKMLVYKAILLSSLLYAWTTYKCQLLKRFHQWCLRNFLRITWEDRRTNVRVPEEAKITRVEATILQHQLGWTGRVVRMPDYRLLEQLLYSELKNGKRNAGGQQKRFTDAFKANL